MRFLVIIAFFCFSLPNIKAQTCSKFQNTNIGLPDIATFNYKEEWECCGICNSYPGCQGYAWNSYEGGTCWLKNGKGPLVNNPGDTSGVQDGDGGGGDQITYDQFASAVTRNGYPTPSGYQYEVFVNSAGPKGQINNKQEAAMALTHFLHESDGLRAKREYACADSQCPNEYRTPGCDADGQYYYGRGYIQLTWCYNYVSASRYLFGDDRLVGNPDVVAQEETLAWDTAFWFWMENVHGFPGVQDGLFGSSTRAINGGLECDGGFQHVARQRFEMYKTVRNAFGLSGDGDERGCYN